MKIEPKNKWLVIEPVDNAGKIGEIFVPGNVTNPYKLARVISVAGECQDLEPGNLVVYDSLGTVSVHVVDRTVTFVKAVNVLGAVKD